MRLYDILEVGYLVPVWYTYADARFDCDDVNTSVMAQFCCVAYIVVLVFISPRFSASLRGTKFRSDPTLVV